VTEEIVFYVGLAAVMAIAVALVWVVAKPRNRP
jgi:hypothetical protein